MNGINFFLLQFESTLFYLPLNLDPPNITEIWSYIILVVIDSICTIEKAHLTKSMKSI